MSREIDWNNTFRPFGTQTYGGVKPKYSSGREYLEKAMAAKEEQDRIMENFQKSIPALQALLKCRIEDKTPLHVVRPMMFEACELVHVRDWNPNTEEYDGEVRRSNYEYVRKSVNPGTTLIFKSLDTSLQEFIFEDQNGNEVVIPYSAKQQLMTQTNVYEDVVKFMNQKGE